MNKEKQLAQQEAGVIPISGGMPRVTYYAPDGTSESLIPNYISGVDLKTKTKVTYDRNILGGLSLTPPTVLKPHCDGCQKWHNTQKEVDACIKKRKADTLKWDKKMAKQFPKEGGEMSDRMDKLEGMFEKILEKLNE